MKRLLIIPILLVFAMGLMFQAGCDSDDFGFDVDSLKQTLFNVAIDQAMIIIEKELVGDKRDERVDYLTDLIGGWLEPTGILKDGKAAGWEDAVGIAYDTVEANLSKVIRKKLKELYGDEWESHYEGADTSGIGLVNHDDFGDYYAEVVAPLK